MEDKLEEHKESNKTFDIEMEKRKEKLFLILKKKDLWVIGFLIIALILGIYIRTMPMQDHGGNPGLWDITTNTWTLGPDLDPFLFLRDAKEIVKNGALPQIDMMRNVPLGFDNSIETQLLPYMIVWTYKFLNIFSEVNIDYAAVILPVIMFCLTIISFFLFVREIFIRKTKESKIKANIISLISTFFMIVIPIFLSRTIAGIPEKESVGFFFMFLSFYFFLKAWKQEKIKNYVIFGILAGISTALMGLVWGGVIYVFIPIAGAVLIAFVLNKVHKKEIIIYSLWICFSIALILLFSKRESVISIFTSLSSGLAFFVFLLLIIHFILWNTKISKIQILHKNKLPKPIFSLIFGIILILILISIFFGPGFIFEKLKAIHENLFNPVTGRWNVTVAENRQPYFTEWAMNFGPVIKNIPILFWMFFIGFIIFFREILKKIKAKHAWVLTILFILFLLGLMFSRYAPHPSILDGENFLSTFIYYGSAFLLVLVFFYYYINYYKEGNKSFENLEFEYLILFALVVFTLFTVRGAVRLIMVLGPIAPILVAYLIMESIEKFKKTKDETWKTLLGIAIILILILSIFSFWAFYKGSKDEAYNFIPSSYTMQWQKAMEWVRNETPKDAVFGHWWDYGYWVQTMGERATMIDGGNTIAYWNYLMGRYVLTGENQDDALEVLYNHNVTHLLIDSTDIGKYTAFSSIGSDKNYDRYSWIGAFTLDETQTQETKNQTILVYTGGIALDEDLVIKENGKEILLPGQAAGVGAIIVPVLKSGNLTQFEQPYIIIIFQGQQYKVNLRYLEINDQFKDFETGIEAAAYIFPSIMQQGNNIGRKDVGAAIFISPRLFRGMLSQIYILGDPLNKFPNFKLVHTQSGLIVESLRTQGMDLPEFVYFNGIQGPIKIWVVNYTGKEQIKKEYQDTDYTKYLSWQL